MNAWLTVVSQKRAECFVIWIILSCFLFLASPLAAQKKSKKKKDKEEQNIVLAEGEVSQSHIISPHPVRSTAQRCVSKDRGP